MTARRQPSLDAIDRRLLSLLQQDATRPLHELGDAVGLSPSAVQRRVTRFRASGVVPRQIAVVDPDVVGETLLAVVLVTLERESAEHHRAFTGRMLATPEVQQCYEVAGEWDYVVVTATRAMSHYREVGDRLFRDDPNIRRYDTLPVFGSVKRGLELPLDQPDRAR